MSFFYDNSLTSITIPSTYSTTGAYAVNGDTRLNIGVIRAFNNPDPSGTGSFNYFMCMSKNSPTGPDTNNYKGIFKITQNGTVYARDTYISSWGADYAEYFESFTQKPIDYGKSVVIVDPDLYELCVVEDDGTPAMSETQDIIKRLHQEYSGTYDYMFTKRGYVREATQDDNVENVIGVVRPNVGTKQPSVIGNTQWDEWQSKYIVDEFGIPEVERYYHLMWSNGGLVYDYPFDQVPSHIKVPSDAYRVYNNKKGEPYYRAKINPLYDPVKQYHGRQYRDEWILVGLVGQMPILQNVPMNPRWKILSKLSEKVSQVLVL